MGSRQGWLQGPGEHQRQELHGRAMGLLARSPGCLSRLPLPPLRRGGSLHPGPLLHPGLTRGNGYSQASALTTGAGCLLRSRWGWHPSSFDQQRDRIGGGEDICSFGIYGRCGLALGTAW